MLLAFGIAVGALLGFAVFAFLFGGEPGRSQRDWYE